MVWDKIINFLKDNLRPFIITGIIILIVALVLFICLIITKKYTKHSKSKRAITLSKLLYSIIKYIVVIAGIISILGVWGFNVTAILAGAGVVGLIVGLGAQDIIKDLLSGISIVFENYYEIDDVVEIKGFKGKVVSIGLRSTQLLNAKGDLKIIANGDISEIINYSRNFSLAVVNFDIAYKEDIDKVTIILNEALALLHDLFPQIIEGPNVVGVDTLADSGVTMKITAKTMSEQQYEVERAIRKLVKETLEKNNIEIPFPQLVIHNEC